MEIEGLEATPWFRSLVQDVRRELELLSARRQDQGPALDQEYKAIQSQIAGWLISLGNRDLDSVIRASIESSWAAANRRQLEIQTTLAERDGAARVHADALDPRQVVSRLERLDEVLAAHNPTRGNLELSRHIDRIDCFPDGRVIMRTCRLGALTDAGHLLTRDAAMVSEGEAIEAKVPQKAKPRRRSQLRINGSEDESEDLRRAVFMAADPNRFAGLNESWFWEDLFQVPAAKLPWAEEHAEVVFQRRQETRLSFSKLADEFGVTGHTIGAAIRRYLSAHPDATDIKLPRGGRRKPYIDVTGFANEARKLWLSGCTKVMLAKKFGCSPPIIDRALAYAYEQVGERMPKRADEQRANAQRARQLHDGGTSLCEIAKTMKVTTDTARKYLKDSFAAENRVAPDLRRRRAS